MWYTYRQDKGNENPKPETLKTIITHHLAKVK